MPTAYHIAGGYQPRIDAEQRTRRPWLFGRSAMNPPAPIHDGNPPREIFHLLSTSGWSPPVLLRLLRWRRQQRDPTAGSR
jgi:hypothetical protein